MDPYQINITKVNSNSSEISNDLLAIEEPLEIQLEYYMGEELLRKSISITMRSPGNDEDLARGFLFTEDIIQDVDQLENVSPGFGLNTVVAKIKPGISIDFNKLERHFYTTSSCGVCGKTSIDAVASTKKIHLPDNAPIFHADTIYALPAKLRESQDVFDQTGGLHAAALFSSSGELLLVREDVGRHNAVDKLIGANLEAKLIDFNDALIMVSGRASFELIQKSLVAGIPMLCAVGAPSSLAVQLAEENNMTLVGFLKNSSFNIYCHPQRILLEVKTASA